MKNDIQSENDDTEVKNKETILKTRKAKVTARADEVKAIEKTLEEFRVEKNKQIGKKIDTEASITLPPHFATTFTIFMLTFTISIFTSNIFIFNPFVSTHHVQIFTLGDLSDGKAFYSRPTNSAQAKGHNKSTCKH